MKEFVVLAMLIKDTAVIQAESENEAVDKYEKPEGVFEPEDDTVIWAMPREEFDEMLKEAA